MKVVFLSTLFRDPESDEYRGGGEISNRILLESIAEKHDVYVVSALGNSHFSEKKNGVTYLCFTGLLKRIAPLPFPGVVARTLFKYFALHTCKKIAPDIVISGTLEPSIASKVKLRSECKTGIFIRAYENFGKNKTVKDYFRVVLYGNNKKKSIDRLDFIITNSDYMSLRCRHEFNIPNVHVVYPSIDFSQRKLSNNSSNSVEKILTISGTEKKGKQTILHLAEQYPDISFSVLGFREGDRADYARCTNIELIEWVSEPAEVISSHDLIIVPSKWNEPFGRISAESLQLGRLVLVSNVGGLPETVCNNPRFIVAHDDLSAWAERVADIRNNKGTYLNEMEKLKHHACNYSLKIQSQNFSEILNKVVAE